MKCTVPGGDINVSSILISLEEGCLLHYQIVIFAWGKKAMNLPQG